MADITFESLNLSSLASMLVLCAGALAIICIDIVKKGFSRSFYVTLCMIFLSVSLFFVMTAENNAKGFFDMVQIDGLSKLSQIIIIVSCLLFAPLSISGKEFAEYKFAEYFAFLLFVAVGFLFMVSTTNLALIFVGLETASLSLYAMIAMHNKKNSIEAALKYFTMGALASGFFAFGVMIFYALAGSIDINMILTSVVEQKFKAPFVLFGGATFVFAALAFKLSLIPFHTWTPDVYEGSSAALAGFMSVVPKIAAFIVVIRIFGLHVVAEDAIWIDDMFYLFAVITMTLANLMALAQSDVKRMLAFSSISHAGFVLCAVVIGSEQAIISMFLYWILFMFVNFGAFTFLWIARNKENLFDERYQHPFRKFSGMVHVAPIGAVIMAIFMLSLAGLPPFSVFWGKIYLMGAAINGGFIWLAVIMAINSAIAVYYYLKLIIYMFLREPLREDGSVYIENTSRPLMAVVGIAVIMAVSSMFFVEQILMLISHFLF